MKLSKVPWLCLLLCASAALAKEEPAATGNPVAYRATPVPSVRKGLEILPMAWLHADIADGNKRAVTVALQYVDKSSRTEQEKIATQTLLLDAAGKFSGAYGDFTRLEGTVSNNQVKLSAAVDNGPQSKPDQLMDVTLTPVASRGLPTPRTYPVTQILLREITAQKFKYEDLWTVSLRVSALGDRRMVTVSYYGQPGTFSSGPVALAEDGSFSGVAKAVHPDAELSERLAGGRFKQPRRQPARTAPQTKDTIRFSGVFLPVEDGVTAQGEPNYPVLSQVYVGKAPAAFSDAAGSAKVLWLETSSSTPSKLALKTAHVLTVAAADARVSRLRGQPGVGSASVDSLSFGTTNIPNDTYFNPAGQKRQYPYPFKNTQLCCTNGPASLAADAWGVAGADGNNVTVAVMDTGVNSGHPDLVGKVAGGHNSLPWPWWADWLRRLLPANWMINSGDLHGHGTGVAGVITANRNNAQGVAGVAQSPRIIPVRVLDHAKAGTAESQIEGILWLLDNNLADVVNMSYMSETTDMNVVRATRTLIERGRVVLAGTGNNGMDGLFAPAALPDVIAVGATDPLNAPADYSNYSKLLDVVAPGGADPFELPVCWLNGRCGSPVFDGNANYCLAVGTSFASPFAAGVVTMILSHDPTVKRNHAHCTGNPRACVAQVAQTLRSTGLVVPTALWNPSVTQARLVQAHAAVTAAVAAALPAPTALVKHPCAGAACIAPGLQLTFTPIAGAPLGYALQGYILYRNGEYMLAPAANDPLTIAGSPFNDTTLRQAGGVPQNETYEYTLAALYTDAAGAYARSISSNVVTVACTPAGCN